MKLDQKKREIQIEALEAWKACDSIGTAEMATGSGKTFVALDACMEEKKGTRVVFLAETTQRETDLLMDIKNYKKAFGKDVLKHVNLEFACYQSAYKWKNEKFGLVIADEIHDSLTAAYVQFYYNNSYKRILGLSATVKSDQTYIIDDQEIPKEVLLDEIAPVCYTYDVGDGQRDGTSRKLDLYLIYHRLDDVKRTIEAGNKQNRFKTTEKKQYDYLTTSFSKAIYSKNEWAMKMCAMKRANFLYSMPSKIEAVKELMEHVEGKSVIFGNHLKSIEQITPNVVRSTRKGESKKVIDNKNRLLRSKFDLGQIDVIGSFKMLKQGANLKGADNVFMMSYYSTMKDFIQRIGRLRKNGNKRGKVFILITLNTQEEKWFNKMISDVPLNEFTVHNCRDIQDCISKLK